MIISTVQPGTATGPRRTLVPSAGDGDAPATVSITPGAPAAPPGSAGASLQNGHLAQILAIGAKAKVADTGVTLLIEQVNRATPAQLSGFFLNNHLAATQATAQSQAEQILDAVQSKTGGAVLIGARAGAITFVVVDSLVPGWSLGRKIAAAVAVGLAVAALFAFGLKDAPPAPAPRPVSAAAR